VIGRLPASVGAWPRDEAVGEVAVDCQGLSDVERVHHHEAQTVHEAVVLVLVRGQVGESRGFLVRGGAVYAAQDTGEELLADCDGER
jgi:hypothetical protein